MSGTLRPPEHFIHGLVEPVVVVPAKFAVWLDRTVGLGKLRERAADPEIRNALTSLALASANASVSAGVGSNYRQAAEVRPQLVVMTTTQAANALGLSGRAIRLAIEDGRLIASKNAAGHWRITRTDLEQYRAARAA
jgi:excisionase family DNA binding protein